MFTVVFNSRAYNLSYRLVFEPCPCWRKFDESWLINLNPETPQYKKGSVKKLIEQEKLYKLFDDEKECMIIVHHEGHGSYGDVSILEEDLMDEGFKVQVCSFPNKRRY